MRITEKQAVAGMICAWVIVFDPGKDFSREMISGLLMIVSVVIWIGHQERRGRRR